MPNGICGSLMVMTIGSRTRINTCKPKILKRIRFWRTDFMAMNGWLFYKPKTTTAEQAIFIYYMLMRVKKRGDNMKSFTVEELATIIGLKEITINELQKQLAAAQAEVEKLKDKKTPGVKPEKE